MEGGSGKRAYYLVKLRWNVSGANNELDIGPIKFSVDRLGYESLKLEQECFCSFAYELRQIVVLRLFSRRF